MLALVLALALVLQVPVPQVPVSLVPEQGLALVPASAAQPACSLQRG